MVVVFYRRLGWLAAVLPAVSFIVGIFVALATKNGLPVIQVGLVLSAIAVAVVGVVRFRRHEADAGPHPWWEYLVDPLWKLRPWDSFMGVQLYLWAPPLIAIAIALPIVFAPDPPRADAGPDQEVAVGAVVQLDGTGSLDGDAPPAFQWAWVERPAGSKAELDPAGGPLPQFEADLAGRYLLRMDVSRAGTPPASDTVAIVAR